ncbi:hypothetical protein E2562_002180 [Oryza meyeriana var. granulata]|uniref:Uncharacterized protein n=1 Tax=Oryza meyeriana var. granulata TaxID=110450 RepID=A0A6G1EG64_9ORYZ|nr:hypothetical protein E2562_002180 [Oryza meyeriana var. granulata]
MRLKVLGAQLNAFAFSSAFIFRRFPRDPLGSQLSGGSTGEWLRLRGVLVCVVARDAVGRVGWLVGSSGWRETDEYYVLLVGRLR